jgi:hypothetical protein
MGPGSSWGTASRSDTQEFPEILWNLKLNYRVQKIPPLVPILNQINPIHTTPFYFSKINFNIILSPMSGSSYWPFSFLLSHQNPLCIPLPFHACYMPCLSHPPWLDHCNYSTWWRVHAIKLVIMQFYPTSCHFISFLSKSNRPWRPIGFWDVEAPTFSRQSAHRWRWCQAYALAALYPQEDSWYSFLLEAESTPGR